MKEKYRAIDARHAMDFNVRSSFWMTPTTQSHWEGRMHVHTDFAEREQQEAIVRFVTQERQVRGITAAMLGADYRPEPSCFAQGEFMNFLYCQLLMTHEGYGGWRELRDPEILQETCALIRRIQAYRTAECRKVG